MEVIEFFNKYKNKICNVAVIIIALIIANNLYHKQSNVITSLQEKKDTEKKKNELLIEINQMGKKLDAYNNLLKKRDAGTAINTISNMAKEFNIDIVSIKPLPEQRFSEYIKFPFDLVINVNNYHILAKFISKIENCPDVYIVEAMEVRSTRERKQLSVNLKISAIMGVD